MKSNNKFTRSVPIFIALIFAVLNPCLCGADTPITVGVSILPQAFFVEKIGGAHIQVVVMVPPGASPATYEPRPRQLASLAQCRLYLAQGLPFESAWLPRFRRSNPAMQIVYCYKGVERVGVSSFEDQIGPRQHSGSLDPHIWLSPPLVIVEARNILKALLEVDPSRAEYYQENYRVLIQEIVDLDLKIQNLFRGVGNRNCFLVYHPAWGYFARAYGLRQIAVEKGGKKPLAHDMKKLIIFARKKAFKYLFIQPQISAHSAQVVAKSIGARLVVLDPPAKQWDTNLLLAAQKIKKALR